MKLERVIQEELTITDLQKRNFALKEVLYIPIGGKEIPFQVEHITDGKVYLVSVNTVEKLSMIDMDKYLDYFVNKLPEELVDILDEIEHRRFGKLVRKSKVTLVSHANLKEDNDCNGADDILFDGLRTKISRRKNDENVETDFWWTDSYVPSSDGFFHVDTLGYVYASVPQHKNGICPCIAILRK